MVAVGHPSAVVGADAELIERGLTWTPLRPAGGPPAEPGEVLVAAVVGAARELPPDVRAAAGLAVIAADCTRRMLVEYGRRLAGAGPGSLSKEHATLLVPSVLNEEAGKAAGLKGQALTFVSSGEAAAGLLWAIDAVAGGELPAVLVAELLELGPRSVAAAVCVPFVAAGGPASWGITWRVAGAGAPVGGERRCSALCEVAGVCATPAHGSRVVRCEMGGLAADLDLRAVG
jgi:hypothetical protein